MEVVSDDLVAAALSEALETEVHTCKELEDGKIYSEYLKELDFKNLCPMVLRRIPGSKYVHIIVYFYCIGPQPFFSFFFFFSSPDIRINLKLLTQQTIPFDCSLMDTVEDIKWLIKEKENILVETLRFRGEQLDDKKRLSDYGIENESSVYLIRQIRGGGDVVRYFLSSGFRAPEFDFDFRNLPSDEQIFKRGGFDYKRPIGTQRIALNVVDKYEDNDWLGVNCRRPSKFSDVPGEWAGTNIFILYTIPRMIKCSQFLSSIVSWYGNEKCKQHC